jgi:hypothetical protein
VEFESEQTYVDIHRSTKGVPFFVGAFQAILLPNGPHGGVNVSSEEAENAFQRFRTELASASFRSSLQAQLTDRELQILRMAHCAAMELNDDRSPIDECLSEDWDFDNFGKKWKELFGDVTFPESYTFVDGDSVVIETLVLSGLLPSDPNSRLPSCRILGISSADPVSRLLFPSG